MSVTHDGMGSRGQMEEMKSKPCDCEVEELFFVECHHMAEGVLLGAAPPYAILCACQRTKQPPSPSFKLCSNLERSAEAMEIFKRFFKYSSRTRPASIGYRKAESFGRSAANYDQLRSGMGEIKLPNKGVFHFC